jgi:hypothetical protein
VVAQTAVGDGGDRAGVLLHVVALARLGVPAVLAVAVVVDPARPAGHAHPGALGRGRQLGGHTWVRCLQRVLLGLRRTVEPYAGGGRDR